MVTVTVSSMAKVKHGTKDKGLGFIRVMDKDKGKVTLMDIRARAMHWVLSDTATFYNDQ
ncbi:hypothetical protein BGW39_004279, partial [Mortierella sp. 14UC]